MSTPPPALRLRAPALQALSFVLSASLAKRTVKLLSRRFVEQIRTSATDEFLELLLHSMDLAFLLSRSYRMSHLRNFSAKYVFTTGDGSAGATARFDRGAMHVDDAPAKDWTVRVRFTDGAALRRFLFAEDQDILDSLLANEVELTGNLNYIYKFGFMAHDLQRRLGA
jgi:hypothetical protein